MWTPKYIKLTNFISFREQIFHFRNNEAILIQGKNSDDSSQRGNGSGKSSLIEAVAVAFSGSPIRNVNAKDLIFNEEKHCELEVFLENLTINKTFKIWRKVYANTKSAECKVWINDKEKSDLPDVNSYNKFIFETLGISKEDFFNFYLITDENGFVPFLKASDTKKKEIINRFSGADKVDNAIPYIEQDAANKQKEIDNVSKEIEKLQSNQQLLTDQILSEEEKMNPDKLDEQAAALRTSIESVNTRIGTHEATISELNSDKAKKEAELSSFVTTDYSATLEAKQAEKSKLEKELAELRQKLADCKLQFADEIEAVQNRDAKLSTDKINWSDEVKKMESDLQAKRKETRESINEYQQFIDDVKNKLAGAITCPSCNHVFSLKDKSFNAEEAKASLPDAENELAALKVTLAAFDTEQSAIDTKNKEKKAYFSQIEAEIAETKQAINNKVLEAQESVKAELFKNAQDTTALTKTILDIENEQQKEKQAKQQIQSAIATLESRIANEKASINTLRVQISGIEKQIDQVMKVDRSKIEELEAKTVELIEKEEQLTAQLEILTEEKKSIDAWGLHFKSFKSHLANQSLKHICDFTNMYLKDMGSNISIEIEGYRILSNKKLKEEITTTVQKDGFPVGVYGKFSKGEKARIDICNVLANQQLINLNSPTGGVNILLCDEVLDAVDSEGLSNIVNACQNLGKTIMIVSQNEVNVSGHTLIIEKKNKVSRIVE